MAQSINVKESDGVLSVIVSFDKNSLVASARNFETIMALVMTDVGNALLPVIKSLMRDEKAS